MIRKFLNKGAAIGLMALMSTVVVAQTTYPERPITLVLPFAAGSATDGATRLIAADTQKTLGQPLVMENRAGADGIIATQYVQRAKPDGYTLLVSTNSAHGSNPSIYKSLPYDPIKDFIPVAGLIRIPMVMVVKSDFPANNLADFVKIAKERKASESLSYGVGNTSNLVAGELFKSKVGVDLLQVQYKSTPPALQDLIGGRVDVMFVDPYSAAAFLSSGQLKPFAVFDSHRHALYPDVPTMAELGFDGMDVVSWAGVFAPAGTPDDIVAKLSTAFNASLKKDTVKQSIQNIAMTPLLLEPGPMADFVSRELSWWANLVKIAHIPLK